MTPNKIIAALLDIAQAAHSMLHSGGPVLHPEDIQALDEAVAVLTVLPQFEPEGHLTGPARARKYLESFLQGEIESLMQRRARAFPPVIVNVSNVSDEKKSELLAHFNLHSGGVVPGRSTLVPPLSGDAIGFEVSQEWKAPPGVKVRIEREFVPSDEFPTSGPISHDFYTHRDAWRKAIKQLADTSPTSSVGATDEAGYWRHELRAFDRAFASLPPVAERRAKPRLDLPTIPVVGKDALIEATRPLFEKAMKADKHRADLDERGLYKGMTEHRFEGWRAAIQVMGFKPGSDDIGALREQAEAWQAVSAALHQHVPEWSKLSTRAMDSAVMTIGDLVKKSGATILHDWLADTADEAHKIINDAGLLANLHDLFKMEPLGEVSIHELKTGGWTIYVDPFDQDTKPRSYRSTSMHQAIVVAHKGERDLLQPEPEECKFCGFNVEAPCDSPPPGECPTAVAAQVKDMDAGIAQANEMQDNMRQYGTIDKPALLTQVGWRHIMHQEHGQVRALLTESKECPWGERGVSFDATYAVTVAPVYEKAGERPEPEGDASTEVPASPTDTDIRRNQMTKLLMDVKDTISVTVAKRVVGEVGKVTRMSDIPADKIEDVIRACEMELKEPK